MDALAFDELRAAQAALQQQGPLYRPSAFWADACGDIAAELQAGGLHRFRALATTLRFFVPTFGPPGSGFSAAQAADLRECLATRHPQAAKARLALDHWLSGEQAAWADFRVLLAADEPGRLPALHTFSESTVGEPVEHWAFEGRRFSRSSLNYLLGLALLKRHLGDELPRTVLEAGGGFGSLGEVWAASGVPGWRYIDVDIPPTSIVASHYLRQVLGSERVAGWTQTHGQQRLEIDRLPPATVLCAWQIEQLQGTVDLFVNFISFQEMEPAIVRNYLAHVDRLGSRWVLLRNLREGKQRRQAGARVGVDEPILGDDYLAMLPNHELVARGALPFGVRTVDGFHSELLLLRRR